MAKIQVEGERYTVLDSLGYVQDVGAYVKEVQTEDGPRKVIKRGKGWYFWTVRDRTEPLRQHKWPGSIG